MRRADEVGAKHKLDTIAHYLLKVFPGAATRSAPVNGGDYRVTVTTPDLLGPCSLHISRTFLNDPHPTVEEVPSLFDYLNLARAVKQKWSIFHLFCQQPRRKDTAGVAGGKVGESGFRSPG